MRYLKWITARLGGPWAGHVVIAIALVLALPSLFSPLFIDEYVQAAKWRSAIDQKCVGRFLSDCFVFGGGDSAAVRWEMEHGMGAWWVAPDWKTAFWRPLSAMTHALDLALWPGNAVPMHLHSLLWFFGLLLALYSLYRRLLTSRVAVLALALYAWDDARGHVLSWVAKRNALVAGLFGVLVIIAYDKWRRDRWRHGAWLAPLLLAAALLSAEMGLATTGFLFAYALCLDKGSLPRRMARLIPYLIVVVVWQVAYAAGGYGAKASVAYINPLVQPGTYAARLLESAPVLFLGQLTPIAADFWGAYPPPIKVAVYLLALALLVILARIAWPRLLDKPQARFWLIGAALSLFPIAAVGPMDGNLVFVGFGAAPALAMMFVHVVDNPPAFRWPRFVVGTLAVFNLAVAPLLLPAKCLTMLGMGFGLPLTDQSIPRNPEVTQKTLVVVWAISEGGIYASWNRRYAERIPKPGKWRILSVSFSDVSVTRLDDITLRLCPKKGFFDAEFQQLMREPSSRPFHNGDVIKVSDMTATVTETTDDGRPKTVEFRFTAPLESPKWLWMRGIGFRLVNWTPPKVGETVVVPARLTLQ